MNVEWEWKRERERKGGSLRAVVENSDIHLPNCKHKQTRAFHRHDYYVIHSPSSTLDRHSTTMTTTLANAEQQNEMPVSLTMSYSSTDSFSQPREIRDYVCNGRDWLVFSMFYSFRSFVALQSFWSRWIAFYLACVFVWDIGYKGTTYPNNKQTTRRNIIRADAENPTKVNKRKEELFYFFTRLFVHCRTVWHRRTTFKFGENVCQTYDDDDEWTSSKCRNRNSKKVGNENEEDNAGR